MKLLILFTLLLTGCGQVEFAPKVDSVLGGRILPIDALSKNQSYFIESAYASVVCDDEMYAHVHKVENNGQLNSTAVASSLVKNNKYEFEIRDLPLDIHGDTVQYQVLISGCEEIFYRPVTELNANQDVSYASTIIGLTAQTVLSIPLSQAPKADIELLIKSLSGTNLGQAYVNLNNIAANSSDFQKIFGDSPNKIADSHPSVSIVSFATMVNEGLSSTFKVSSLHFDQTYNIAQEWKLDGAPTSLLNQWVFSPGPDAAGTYVVSVIVGRNDGTGHVDQTKPFFSHAQNVTVLNTIPATAPDFNLVASSSSTGSFSVKIQTGTAQENCASFESFLFTDSANKPLASNAGFTRLCSVDVEQNETVVLSGADGARNLSLWVKDHNGIVSDFAKTHAVYLDSTVPTITLTAPSSLLKGGDSSTISFTASDAVTGLGTLILQFASDGVTFVDLGAVSTAATSYVWTVPSINTASAKIKFIATDIAGNTTAAVSSAFTIDSSSPAAPAVALYSANPTNSVNATLTISSCTDRPMIFTSNSSTAPSSGSAGWQNCTTTPGAITAQASAGDGTKTIYIWAKDTAGNVSSSTTATTVLDQTAPGAPAILFSANSTTNEKKTSASTTLTVSSCTDRTKILITTSTATPLPADGNWQNCVTTAAAINFTLSPAIQDTSYTLRAWSMDASGNISSPTLLTFLYDITPPILTSINVNNGQTSTGNNNLLVSLIASSSRADISAFCLKYNNPTAPLSSDSCWMTLTSLGYSVTDSFSLVDYPYQVGTILGAYEIRAWVKDELGNITTVTDTANTDLYTIAYNPDPPPSVSNVIASSTDTPSNPLTSADTTATVGSDVYIRWNITDNQVIPNGNVSLYYTTNESTYTLIANGLNNADNGSCTVDALSTGCFKWTAASPLSSYYKIKVAVTDSGISNVFSMTNPLNTGNVNFLSGNTSLGIGGSANSAILIGEGEAAYGDSPDNGALAVTKTGYVFYKYKDIGLVYVSPENGILKILIPQTGTYSGHGVSASTATLRSLKRINLDYEGNILIWDHDRIRKINLSVNPWRIDTIAGGGADTSDGAAALSASVGIIDGKNLFTPTPDGRVYYQKTNEIWYFDPLDNKVKKHLALTGLGTENMAGVNAVYDNATCPMSFMSLAFNKTTSALSKIIRKGGKNTNAECGALAPGAYTAGQNTSFNTSTGIAESPHPASMEWSTTSFTGLDGKIYLLVQGRGYLSRYNPTTNAYENILGNGTSGRCPDGTPALSCSAIIMSAFINEYGKVYFVDMGVIRTVDQAGLVQTLAGQPRNYGIGANPISARYSKIAFFNVSGNDVYVTNKLENQIVKFSFNGGQLTHVAGNGSVGYPVHDSVATASKLPGCSWGMPCGFQKDVANNRLYYMANLGKLSYIDLATGKWFIENYTVQDSSARISFLGQNASGLIAYVPSHGGATSKVTLRLIDQNALSNTVLYGKDQQLAGNSTSLCSGVAGTDCTIAETLSEDVQTQIKYDSVLDSWLLSYRARKTINLIPNLGGTVTPYTTTVNDYITYEFRRVAANEYVYYCGTNGNIYKRDVIAGTETILTLPSTTIKCAGHALEYNSTRDSLVFIYIQNGLYGIAEYKNP